MGDIADGIVASMMDLDFDEWEDEDYIGPSFTAYKPKYYSTPKGMFTHEQALKIGYWCSGDGNATLVCHLGDAHLAAIVARKKKNGDWIPKIIQKEFDKRNINGWMELIS